MDELRIERKIAPINQRDIERIAEAADQQPEETLIVILEPNAVMASVEMNGIKTWSWELSAEITIRTADLLYAKWIVEANAPWVDATVEEIKKHWAEIVAGMIATDLIQELDSNDD